MNIHASTCAKAGVVQTILKSMKNLVLYFVRFGIEIIFIPVAITSAILARFISRNSSDKPRLVWGCTPIINNKYWALAMRSAGHESETFMTGYYHINKRSDWDRVLTEEYRYVPYSLRPYLAFLISLFKYDIFFISFNGYFLKGNLLYFLTSFFLKLSAKKVVLLPYGSDAYVYRNIRSHASIHCLLTSYPQYSKKQNAIALKVEYWCKNADCLVPGMMGFDGFGRWDVLIPSTIFVDLIKWSPVKNRDAFHDKSNTVRVAHTPNHRGVKGSEFLVQAVEDLKSEGLNIELILMEGVPNDEVAEFLKNKADILVELLIGPGHGISALEGMACGLPVISNLEFDEQYLPFRRWSYFGECPIVSASPENIKEVLKRLVSDKNLRYSLGDAGRAYVEKYHGLDSAQFLFSNIIDYVSGRRESLINLYHPLLGEYPNRLNKIKHPLVNNRIVE